MYIYSCIYAHAINSKFGMENMCLNDATLVLEQTKFLTIGF